MPPSTGGAHEHLTGTTWYTDPGYFVPVTLWPGTKWHGKYVGVYEPPVERGRVVAPDPVVSGTIIRDLERLRGMAFSWVERYQLAERPGMRLFAEAPPLEPMLARVRGRRGRPYYLVPFGSHRAEVQAAMILNAYTGAYEQSIVLSQDCFLKFLTKEEALELAIAELRVPAEWLTPPRLIFTPSVETPSRFFPVWHTRLRREIFVTPRAEAVHRLAATEEEFWSRAELR
jgi:hypothetical protein